MCFQCWGCLCAGQDVPTLYVQINTWEFGPLPIAKHNRKKKSQCSMYCSTICSKNMECRSMFLNYLMTRNVFFAHSTLWCQGEDDLWPFALKSIHVIVCVYDHFWIGKGIQVKVCEATVNFDLHNRISTCLSSGSSFLMQLKFLLVLPVVQCSSEWDKCMERQIKLKKFPTTAVNQIISTPPNTLTTSTLSPSLKTDTVKWELSSFQAL